MLSVARFTPAFVPCMRMIVFVVVVVLVRVGNVIELSDVFMSSDKFNWPRIRGIATARYGFFQSPNACLQSCCLVAVSKIEAR
jgi:hypothetical protein